MPQEEAALELMHGDLDELCVNDFGSFWDRAFMGQDVVLPEMQFDTDMLIAESRPGPQPEKVTTFSQFSSRLPPLDIAEDDSDVGEEGSSEDTTYRESVTQDYTGPNPAPSSMPIPTYKKLCSDVQSYASALPAACSMPTINALSRGLETYLKCAQKYLSFIHVATFCVEKRDVELVLAMAAIGLLYRFEHTKSYELYFMARMILLEKLRCEHFQLASDVLCNQDSLVHNKSDKLRKIQTLILLITLASWGSKKVRSDAVSMAGELAKLVREHGMSELEDGTPPADWTTWVAAEERRRTLFAAYVLGGLHNIAFDIPPLILNHEIDLLLPDFVQSWVSDNTIQWQQAPRQSRRMFQEGLRSLFDGRGIARDASISSFSCYLLILAIIQEIYLERHRPSGSLRPESIETFEVALRAWQTSWELTEESSPDPLTSKAPFGLTSAALLRLAYIHLNVDRGNCKRLLWGDLHVGTHSTFPLDRSSHVERAVLHAAHALSIPVRLGIAFMAATKTPIWSIEHSLCSLESALLLKDWLGIMATVVQASGIEALHKSEKRLIRVITAIIQETDHAETLDFPDDDATRYQRMAATVVKLWTHVYQGTHVLEIDDNIRNGLRLVADSLHLNAHFADVRPRFDILQSGNDLVTAEGESLVNR
ncbi:hypothetical protein F5Y19DRAFT_483589 [Xylariaceae sp. FL1651]|nr:hypothetical protein F5Y19DRAFT_483589 [Xylariaceae sp. FL1651]